MSHICLYTLYMSYILDIYCSNIRTILNRGRRRITHMKKISARFVTGISLGDVSKAMPAAADGRKPFASRCRARDYPCQLPDDRPRHRNCHHRATGDARDPRLYGYRTLLGAECLFAYLRGFAPARCPVRGHSRRRRMFVIGIALFTLASLAVGLAPSASWLVGARAVQGIGAAILAPSTLALLMANYPEGRERTGRLHTMAPLPVSGPVSVLSSVVSSPPGFPGESHFSLMCLSGLS